MAVLDAIDDGSQLAAHPAVGARVEDLGDLVAGQPPQAGLVSGHFVRQGAPFEEAVDNSLAEEVVREDPPRWNNPEDRFGPGVALYPLTGK